MQLKFSIFFSILFSFQILFAQTPQSPQIDYVTVNRLSQKPEIRWIYSEPENISGFIVKRLIYSFPGVADYSWNSVAVIYDPATEIFQDNSTVYGEALPNIRNETYRLVAFLEVGAQIYYSIMSDAHKTIFSSVSYNECLNSNIISWTKYDAWGSNIKEYEIFCSQNNSYFIKIGNSNSNDTVFEHKISSPALYKYIVRAVRNDNIFSESNICEIQNTSADLPDFINFDSLIYETNSINIFFNIDTQTDISNYTLFRKSENLNKYDSVYSFSTSGGTVYSYSDTDYKPDLVYEYFLAAKNRCNFAVMNSDTISNIALTGITPQINERIDKLKWNDKNLSRKYNIYRAYEQNTMTLIATSDVNFFDDDISDIYFNNFETNTTSGIFSYYVSALAGNSHTFIKSNIFRIFQTPQVYLPNTFKPDSNIEENRVFKPKIAFVTSYLLVIYDKNGNIVFETTNTELGWDGKLPGGENAPQASYIYFIVYTNASGIKTQHKNFINLIR